ncbi:lytic transglycosylase domain-containing protein [Nitrosospira sp. Is2]|uniref:lytic transglycosylase domain-containing protein n=1 Tax=Nitrosospira sp. Is2 TaxID=3080532 RepID=UPI002953E0EB|nr:lytic transglycosylase domain-containing protein [Nitrosospira sp. Is2]WON74856.1 lytic transglycosylase domain-containing protein [Nitrosospira sp. Is2]
MRPIAPRRLPLLLAALLAFGLATPAGAEIYSFTDENGVMHFSNVPTDERYVPLTGPSAGVKRAVAGPSNTPVEPRTKAQYGGIIEEIARAYGLESALIHAVVSVESAYRVTAVSKKGAGGLMQLMPETAQRYGVTDRLDPVQNLHGGARYLSDLLKMFNGDMRLTLAAYNAGENNVIKYGNQIPPFQETRAYVPKVMELYRKYQASPKLTSSRRGV